MTRFALITAAALSILATAIPAKAASHCTQTCYMIGNQRVCNTTCY